MLVIILTINFNSREDLNFPVDEMGLVAFTGKETGKQADGKTYAMQGDRRTEACCILENLHLISKTTASTLNTAARKQWSGAFTSWDRKFEGQKTEWEKGKKLEGEGRKNHQKGRTTRETHRRHRERFKEEEHRKATEERGMKGPEREKGKVQKRNE